MCNMTTRSLTSFLREHGTLASTLAGHLKINKSTISRWKRVPAERVLEVEKATGIPREEIRPDIYPPASSTSQEASQ